MTDVQWYYARNDEQFGPVSGTELKQLADAGSISPDDLLWREGMEAWTTAINLRGLFGEGAPVEKAAVIVPASPAPRATAPAAPVRTGRRLGLRTLVGAVQAILWSTCVLIVLAGAVLFTRAFLAAQDAVEEAAAGAVFGTFCIAAYVLARSGEKLSRMLLALARRRSR